MAPILALGERQTRAHLERLQHSGWVASISVGMIERRQRRWFLTSQSAEVLYVNERAPAQGEGGAVTRTAEQILSPFTQPPSGVAAHGACEHIPWTAASRGVRSSLRRLAALEMLYRFAPSMLESGWLFVPRSGTASQPETRMTDFRLLRNGGWYHAVAHYGASFWAAFTYVGLHTTERSLRRKRAHRFWGLDVYASEHGEYELAAERVFYEDPKREAVPSAQVVLAADSWAAQLAQREFARDTRPLICTPEGRWNDPVELRPSDDRVDDPITPVGVGKAEHLTRWQRRNADAVAITDPQSYAIFTTVAQFPAMDGEQLSRLLGASSRRVNAAIETLVEVGLVVCYDGHCYLTERGLRRAANLNRLLASALVRRHGAYLSANFRHLQLRHDMGVNRLVVQFADEGAPVFAGWRGEINLPSVTQIKPDLLVQVVQGPFGGGAYCVEFERSASSYYSIVDKLRPYRRCVAAGRAVPMLMVCETEQAAERFAEYDALLPLLVTHTAAVEAGRLTGDVTVWRQQDADTVSLHCRR